MSPARPLRWLYLDLDSFFASIEQELDPALRGRPVAVGPGAIDSGTIIAASYEAKAFGVKTGMRVGEAKRRCPGLVFAASGHHRYTAFHRAILAEIGRHLPVTHVCSIDEFACRLLDNENNPAVAAALARRIKAGIRARVGQCLSASVGIAPSRLLAKIAAEREKPDGLTILTAPDLPEALFPLPLEAIPGIGAATLARLRARGITTMAGLLRTRPADTVGTRIWLQLHGEDTPEPPQRSRSVGHSHVLPPSARHAAAAQAVARRLLLRAAVRLRRAGLETRHLTLHARLESGAAWSARCRLSPTSDSHALLGALERLLPRLPARVRMVGVSLGDARPDQPMLPFEGPSRSARLWQALDSLEARFGPGVASLGPPATGRAREIGSRIAFGRIPAPLESGPVARRTAPARAAGC
ncbi:DNA polymerase Y family protein [Thermaurantiacus sp.]